MPQIMIEFGIKFDIYPTVYRSMIRVVWTIWGVTLDNNPDDPL
jgi:hypothetical protein